MATVILGANGRIGRMAHHFAQRAGLGWKTQARHETADVNWDGNFDHPAADDICHRGATLINLIGDTGTDAERLHATNVTFVERLLQRAADAGVAHVLLASTAAVYGPNSGGPLDEMAPMTPTSPYGASKAAMEDAAHRFAAKNGALFVSIMRISNVSGADVLGEAAATSVAQTTPMTLHRFPNGTAPRRSYIGPQDLFRAMRDLSTPASEQVRVFNVAHPQTVTLDDMLRAYKRHLFPSLDWVDAPAPSGAIASVVLATERLQAHTTFAQSGDPANALAADLAAYRKDAQQ